MCGQPPFFARAIGGAVLVWAKADCAKASFFLLAA
jgi:hypothetical protein